MLLSSNDPVTYIEFVILTQNDTQFMLRTYLGDIFVNISIDVTNYPIMCRYLDNAVCVFEKISI